MKGSKFAAFLALLLFCACVPTPEQDFVVQKNTGSLIEKASASGSEALVVPDVYAANFESAGKRLLVDADARVSAPKTQLPIVRVRPCSFDREQIEKICGVLFGEEAYYVKDRTIRTKASILRQAETLQTDLENWDTARIKYDMRYDSVEDARAALEQLMQSAAQAPDVLPQTEPSYDELPLKGSRESASDFYISITAMPDEATYSYLMVWSMPEDNYIRLDYIRDDVLSVGATVDRRELPEQTTLSEQSAKALCNSAIRQMGLDGYALSCAYPQMLDFGTIPVYELYYTFSLDGAQMTYANPGDTETESFAAPWEQTEIRFVVDEAGILLFSWKNPFVLEQTEVAACALMPFESVVDIFEKNVVLVQNQVDYNEIFPDLKETLHITEVRLGLVSIREQNSATGLLVPAWDFLGYRSNEINGKISVYDTNERDSFLTINAVDGSIISRANGY